MKPVVVVFYAAIHDALEIGNSRFAPGDSTTGIVAPRVRRKPERETLDARLVVIRASDNTRTMAAPTPRTRIPILTLLTELNESRSTGSFFRPFIGSLRFVPIFEKKKRVA